MCDEVMPAIDRMGMLTCLGNFLQQYILLSKVWELLHNSVKDDSERGSYPILSLPLYEDNR